MSGSEEDFTLGLAFVGEDAGAIDLADDTMEVLNNLNEVVDELGEKVQEADDELVKSAKGFEKYIGKLGEGSGRTRKIFSGIADILAASGLDVRKWIEKGSDIVSSGWQKILSPAKRAWEWLGDKVLTPRMKLIIQGVRKFADVMGGAFGGVVNSVRSLGGAISNVFGSIGSLISNAVGGLGGAFKSVASFIDSTVERAMNPQMSYDSTAAQAAKTVSAITVGMKASRGEINQWTSAIVAAGYKTAESMEDIGQSFVAAKKLGVDLEKALGTKGLLNTTTVLAKVTSVFGIEGAKLAQTFATLKKTFNVNEIEAKKMGDRIFTIGKQFNIGREAIQQWPSLVEQLGKEFADMGRDAKPEDIQKYSESIIKLGGVISQGLGKPAEESLELAKSIFTTMAVQKREVIDMFRGMGGEFSQFSQGLAEAGGDAGKAFELISKDPLTFMKGLQKMAQESKNVNGTMGVQFQRLSANVNKTLGPDAAMLLRANWGEVNKTLEGLPQVLNKNTESFTKAAEAAHKFVGSGDPMSQMLEAFDRRMYGLVRTDMKQWFGNMRAGFRNLGDDITKLVKDGGPLGGMTKRFLMFQRVGVSGLFTQGNGMGKSLTQAFGFLGALQKIGLKLEDIPDLIMKIPAVLGASLFDEGLRKDMLGSLRKITDWVMQEGPGLFGEVGDGLMKLWNEVLVPSGTEVWAFLESNVPVWSRKFAELIDSVDWDGVGISLVSNVSGLFDTLSDTEGTGKNAFKSLFEASTKAIGPVLDLAWKKVKDLSLELLGWLAVKLGEGLVDLIKWASKKAANMFMIFLAIPMAKAMSWVAEKVQTTWNSVITFARVAVLKAADAVATGVQKYVVAPLMKTFDSFEIAMLQAWKGIMGAFGTGSAWVQNAWKGLLSSLIDMIAKFLTNIAGDIADPIVNKLKSWSKGLQVKVNANDVINLAPIDAAIAKAEQRKAGRDSEGDAAAATRRAAISKVEAEGAAEGARIGERWRGKNSELDRKTIEEGEEFLGEKVAPPVGVESRVRKPEVPRNKVKEKDSERSEAKQTEREKQLLAAVKDLSKQVEKLGGRPVVVQANLNVDGKRMAEVVGKHNDKKRADKLGNRGANP